MKLFLDIETVPQFEYFRFADAATQGLFEKKFSHEMSTHPDWAEFKESVLQDHYRLKGGLHAEFGQIVCVSFGRINDEGQIIFKSLSGADEHQILSEAAKVISKASGLVAHNGKDFDYPWLCRRMNILRISLPELLQIQGKKPWEIKLEDTAEMWRYGQFKYPISLALLCHVFGLPSPKEGMDGSQVADVFHREKNYQKIEDYCQGDVAALINVYQCLNYKNPIRHDDPQTTLLL